MTWIQLTAKPNFELKKQTFLALQRSLADALHIPAVFHCKQRGICDCLEGLCVLLRRTSYPCRFSDTIHRFPRPVSVLSLITNEVMDFIYDNHCHLVTEWNRDVLSSVALQQLTCDQASLFFFAAGRYAWYKHLTVCLLLVQNLDFSLIGQETKGT